MKQLITIFLFSLLAGCVTDPYRVDPPSSRIDEDIVGDCGAGLDKSIKAKLGAELKARGGAADVGFQNSLRAAIINLVKELDLPPEDRAQTVQHMYDKYLDCVEKKTTESRKKEARVEGLSCRAACCKQHKCADDCPMTQIQGYPVPVNEGNSCKEYMTSKWGCMTYPNGFTQCGMMPTKISYAALRSCLDDCPK